MVFSSLIFLFCFLPLVLTGYFLMPVGLKNFFLLLASLFFYAWGEGPYILVMLGSVVCCYAVGFALSRCSGLRKKMVLAGGVLLTLLPLLYFKYGVFLVLHLNQLIGNDLLPLPGSGSPVHLPLGISFFTFQALSYLFDISRNTSAVQKNPISLGLYITLFPQLVAGPIVRYHDIAEQLNNRRVTSSGFSLGLERFILGLGKKVLLANTFAKMADAAYGLPASELTGVVAWLGVISYALQIYYDFSGYSDMAIGLGRMFGFTFLENFNFPYISRSIQEFWRRWHISLSNWFRDYLYIPLGGNRRGNARTALNLFIVFFLCGFWHGASWNFIIWGLYHGCFLALERGRFGQILKRLPVALQHFYAINVVLFGWILFRAETLPDAQRMIYALFNRDNFFEISFRAAVIIDPFFFFCLFLGVICACPWHKNLGVLMERYKMSSFAMITDLYQIFYVALLYLIVIICLASLSTGAYNPFIYFRF